mmetsp:Transcript_27534/g.49977  ORF Transcript_27534/g.49977 Transcript_27534/m.49977 type:complete len:204 (-) Transcript_27534:920-1531(-)
MWFLLLANKTKHDHSSSLAAAAAAFSFLSFSFFWLLISAMPASPMARSMTCSAMAHTPRISSNAASSAFFFSSGKSLGTNGSTSLGLSTSLHMLMITVAAFLFSCMAPREVRERERIGTITARDDPSTGCTKVQCIKSSSALAHSLGSLMAAMTEGTTGKMSGLPMTPHASSRLALAAFATSFLVSRRHVVTRGTMSGMQMLS